MRRNALFRLSDHNVLDVSDEQAAPVPSVECLGRRCFVRAVVVSARACAARVAPALIGKRTVEIT